MIKKLKLGLIALLLPLIAFAQSYPSPTFNNVTSQGLATLNNVAISGTFTATGNVSLASLAAQAANTVVANATASSASPTAIPMPSCSATGNALTWTSASGFGCATGYAPLASPTFTGTPAAPTATLGTNTTQIATTAFVIANAVTANSPTITTPNIVGVTNGSNATAGSVGELISATGTSTAITTTTATNATSISLTAGDWDVQSVIQYTPGSGATVTTVTTSVSTTSATQGSFPTVNVMTGSFNNSLGSVGIASPIARLNITSTTTVYAVGLAIFSGGTCNFQGFIRARRVR